ncbi:MAG: DUF2130 domain-containing protein [candidate division WOR-3 bacterium]
MEKNFIVCPKCKTEIDVNEVLYSQIEESLKKDFEARLKEKEEKLKKEFENLQKAQEDFEKKIKEKVEEKLIAEKKELEKKIKKDYEVEYSSQIEEFKKTLEEKSNQVKELNKTKAEIERLKREKEELRDQIILEKEKELNEKLRAERERIRKTIEEDIYMKMKEKDKLIEDLKKEIENAKRKAEQGSVQIQGEVQELEIEKILKENFPDDKIEPIEKGKSGADVLQIIIEKGRQIGKIYYESKRTKTFGKDWIKKLKEDNLEKKADLLVLVTDAFPDGHKNFFNMEGVWVCSLEELKPLAMILRHMLVQINLQKNIQSNRKEKAEILYDYITSNEFKNQFEAIVNGFVELKKGYDDEKLKMQKIWKEREKQLEMILSNAAGLYGSFKGYLGGSMKEIKLLESEEKK